MKLAEPPCHRLLHVANLVSALWLTVAAFKTRGSLHPGSSVCISDYSNHDDLQRFQEQLGHGRGYFLGVHKPAGMEIDSAHAVTADCDAHVCGVGPSIFTTIRVPSFNIA